jgi:hypothetical protein
VGLTEQEKIIAKTTKKSGQSLSNNTPEKSYGDISEQGVEVAEKLTASGCPTVVFIVIELITLGPVLAYEYVQSIGTGYKAGSLRYSTFSRTRQSLVIASVSCMSRSVTSYVKSDAAKAGSGKSGGLPS